jgi:hypothetical protein
VQEILLDLVEEILSEAIGEVLWDLMEEYSNRIKADSVAETLSSLVEEIIAGATVSLFVTLDKLEVSISEAVIEKTYLRYSERKSSP